MKVRGLSAGSMIRRTGGYSIEGIRTKLAEEGERDDAVGITHVALEREGNWGLHAADVDEKTLITPHFHRKRQEKYRVLAGDGVMHLGTPTISEGRVIGVKWTQHRNVKAGDEITVSEGQVHSLENTSVSEKLLITFSCPGTHLNKDRVVVGIDPRTNQPFEG